MLMNEKLLKLILILLVYLPMASTDIFVPALPGMVSSLHTDVSTIGLVLSSYMLGFSISMLTTGALSDIYGRRIVLISTMSLYVISCVLIIFCHSIYLFIFLRFFQGLGGGSGSVVGMLILKDYFHKDEQVNMMSTLSTGAAIAPALAPQIGVLCTNYFAWQSCFVVSFLAGVLVLWLLVFKLKETNSNLSKYNPIKELPMSLIKVFNTREFIGFTLLISFAWRAYFNFVGLSSFLFQKVYLYSEHKYAFTIGLITVGYLLGSMFTRVLNKKHFSINTIIQIGVVISSIGGVIMLFSYMMQMPIMLVVAMFVVRFGIGLIMPTSQVGAMRSHSENTGWYMGCLFFVEFLLGSATLYLAGFLEVIQIGAGLMVSILFSIILFWLGVFLIKNKQVKIQF